jgi:hypothetical protein
MLCEKWEKWTDEKTGGGGGCGNDQILILIFAEVLGLYGLIVALILNTRSSDTPAVSPPRGVTGMPK